MMSFVFGLILGTANISQRDFVRRLDKTFLIRPEPVFFIMAYLELWHYLSI